MASIHKDTRSMLEPYIKSLASYGKTLPAVRGSSSSSMRPSGSAVRNKQPNVPSPSIARPSGRPPAEHIVKLLVTKMTTDGIRYKPSGTHVPNIRTPAIHPGKALSLRKVKAIHLGKPTVKKVVA